MLFWTHNDSVETQLIWKINTHSIAFSSLRWRATESPISNSSIVLLKFTNLPLLPTMIHMWGWRKPADFPLQGKPFYSIHYLYEVKFYASFIKSAASVFYGLLLTLDAFSWHRPQLTLSTRIATPLSLSICVYYRLNRSRIVIADHWAGGCPDSPHRRHYICRFEGA